MMRLLVTVYCRSGSLSELYCRVQRCSNRCDASHARARAFTHHHRDVQQVHVFVQDARGLVDGGLRDLRQLLRAAHGHVKIQRPVLQPLLFPVHLRDVRTRPRHLWNTQSRGNTSVTWPHLNNSQHTVETDPSHDPQSPYSCRWNEKRAIINHHKNIIKILVIFAIRKILYKVLHTVYL